MRCDYCDLDLIDSEVAVTDGDKYLCEDCARKTSNWLFNKLIREFEAEEKVYQMAFATYGNDDLWNCIHEVIEE